jgi:hypothetical protein
MTGPCLTTAAPEAAPGELFAGDAATLKSEQLPSDLRGFFRRWRHSEPPIFVCRQTRVSRLPHRSPPPGGRAETLQIF